MVKTEDLPIRTAHYYTLRSRTERDTLEALLVNGIPCNVVVLHTPDIDPRDISLEHTIAQAGCVLRYVCVDAHVHGGENADCQRWAGDIEWATTVVVLITFSAIEERCLDWLVKYAKGSNRRVVGLWVSAVDKPPMPDGLDCHADAVVPVTGGRVVSAICGEYDGWENPDGTPYEPRDISRHRC
jgi:hypothetical protein